MLELHIMRETYEIILERGRLCGRLPRVGILLGHWELIVGVVIC